MPISERMLRKWRGEALVHVKTDDAGPYKKQAAHKILLLTQELLDQALLRRETPK